MIAKPRTLAQLVKDSGNLAQAHYWLVQAGVTVPYHTLWRWVHKKQTISGAYRALLSVAGIIV